MSDRVREAFEALIAEMEDPPTWEEVRVLEVRPRPQPQRPRSVGVAVATFVAVLALGAVGVLLTTQDPASVTVPYVQLDWTQRVEMRCEGMEIVDNGGFENATLEIWGPTAEDMIRVDATAPDGAVEILVVRMSDTSRPVQVWSSYETESDSVFRVSECTRGTALASESFSMADPPFHPRAGAFPLEFVGFPLQLPNGTPVDPAEFLGANADSVREDTWRDVPVTVYTMSDEFTDEFGINDRTEEWWVDLDKRRYERLILDHDIEMLGHLVLTTETVDRSNVAVAHDFFSTDDLINTQQ